MTYDSIRKQVVLVSSQGVPPAWPNSLTWTWYGSKWTLQHPATSPPANQWRGMAFDPARGVAVMNNGGTSNDRSIWEWDGDNWHQQVPLSGPAPYVHAQLAWCPALNAVITLDADGNTWAWNGQAWRQITSAHPVQHAGGATLAYLPASDRVVMYSGSTGTATSAVFDGRDWTPVQGQLPPPTHLFALMAPEPSGDRLVLFGGMTETDTWAFDGRSWTKLPTTAAPCSRTSTGPTFNLATAPDGVLVFGGFHDRSDAGGPRGDLGDTWIWTGKDWLPEAGAVCRAV